MRSFFTFVFFINRLILVSKGLPKIDFEFCQIFVELFVLEIVKNWLLAVTDSRESKIER
jgi:hypothetical protein